MIGLANFLANDANCGTWRVISRMPSVVRKLQRLSLIEFFWSQNFSNSSLQQAAQPPWFPISRSTNASQLDYRIIIITTTRSAKSSTMAMICTIKQYWKQYIIKITSTKDTSAIWHTDCLLKSMHLQNLTHSFPESKVALRRFRGVLVDLLRMEMKITGSR